MTPEQQLERLAEARKHMRDDGYSPSAIRQMEAAEDAVDPTAILAAFRQQQARIAELEDAVSTALSYLQSGNKLDDDTYECEFQQQMEDALCKALAAQEVPHVE